MKINDGGPAFPVGSDAEPASIICDSGYGGMTLRDYFAAAATDTDVDWWIPSEMGQAKELANKLCIDTSNWLEAYSRLRCWARYKHADAMIAERERKPT